MRRRRCLKTGLLTQTSFLQHCKNAKIAEKGLRLHVYVYSWGHWLMSQLLISSIFLLVVESWNRQHHSRTILATEKFNSIDLFKILCVVTWTWLFLTSMIMEAVICQNIIGSAHFGTFTHPTVPVLLTRNKKQSKCSPINKISYSFQPLYLEF